MYHHIVITCGVSLLNKSENVFSMNRDEIMGEIRPWLNAVNIDEEKKRKIDQWIRHAWQFAHEVAQNPNRVSAEYSMMYELRRQGKLAERPTVVLIVTETVGGWIVEAMLTRLLEKDFQANVRIMYVDVDVNNPRRMQETLGEYMKTVADAFRVENRRQLVSPQSAGIK
ncbi:hypothetical protein LR69_03426 [Geobacillus sp. BCO2]|nr:hypothetical protein LR69_03426 [Geobacillus sp. BCO2]